VVRARLANLLASLGELPAAPPEELALELYRFLDQLPRPLTVLQNKFLPPVPAAGYSGLVEHLVVAPRGLVIVGPRLLGEARGPSCGAHGQPAAGPSPVREALRRARAVRLWLSRAGWPEAPVLAAVCLRPGAGGALAPVVVGELWVGEPASLPAWLASGAALGPAERAGLAELLRDGLCDS
jgi:hypothetical protein